MSIMYLIFSTATSALSIYLPGLIIYKKINILHAISFAVLVAISPILIKINPQLITIFASILLGLVCYKKEHNKMQTVYIIVFSYTIANLADMLNCVLFLNILKLDMMHFFTSIVKNIFYLLPMLILGIFISIFISKFLNMQLKKTLSNKYENAIICSLTVVYIFCIACVAIGRMSNLNPYLVIIVTMANAIFIIVEIFSISFLISKDMNEKELSFKNDVEYERELYTNNITTLLANIKDDLHNFNSERIALLSHMPDEYKETLESKIASGKLALDQIDKNSDNLIDIKIIGLRYLIYTKILEAESRGIFTKLVVVYLDNSKQVHMNEIELCKMVGILLDNAIEESQNVESGFVSIRIEDNFEIFKITIENQTSKYVNVAKIFDDGYSTKGMNRGIGLPFVKKKCKEYNIIEDISFVDQVFKIVLPINKQD